MILLIDTTSKSGKNLFIFLLIFITSKSLKKLYAFTDCYLIVIQLLANLFDTFTSNFTKLLVFLPNFYVQRNQNNSHLLVNR